MLANTTSGLSYQNMKTLHDACVPPVLSYALQVWWTGNKGRIRKIESIPETNNASLHHNTYAHYASEISGVPPLHMYLNHMKQQAGA